tara:strand:+ start:2556 stop:2861 length:306 start_codon:yes stop_codon:yes gene_type:complete
MKLQTHYTQGQLLQRIRLYGANLANLVEAKKGATEGTIQQYGEMTCLQAYRNTLEEPSLRYRANKALGGSNKLLWEIYLAVTKPKSYFRKISSINKSNMFP